MANYEFGKDIKIGEFGENIVIKDLERCGINFISDNKDNKFDLLMGYKGEEVKYEVKTDVFCRPDLDTGNIFIEFECRGKESGIMVTEAKWFVTYFKHLKELWYIKSDDLRQIIQDNNFKIIEFGGDSGSNTKGYLIPRYQFKKDFIVKLVPRKWVE